MNEHDVIKFYQEYSPRILRYLKKYLPIDEAKEILNDVFLEAVDSMPTLQKQTNLQAWLYKIAHNKVVDFYRKKKIKTLLLSHIPFLEVIAQKIYEPEFQYEKNKMRDAIQSALRSLSQKYRTILQLHYEQEKSIKEIALILDISPKAAESLLFRARQKFKEKYGEK